MDVETCLSQEGRCHWGPEEIQMCWDEGSQFRNESDELEFQGQDQDREDQDGEGEYPETYEEDQYPEKYEEDEYP